MSKLSFDKYDTGGYYDEVFSPDGEPRPGCFPLIQRINELPDGELRRRQVAAESALLGLGITFSVYGQDEGTERIFPFDTIPRIVSASDWDMLERGLKQRVYALNLFIQDVYNDGKILRDGVVPEEIVRSCRSFREACSGLKPPRGVWCHITGTDIVRDSDGQFYVLEDNLRCPSGVSYVLESRSVMKRTFPVAFESCRVRPVVDYPSKLMETLFSLLPERVDNPTAAILTPGVYNSAYFEHAFLAKQMGVELVEGRDLVVLDGRLMMRTTKGFDRVDILYRRIDDDFLDPNVFRSDSFLGVPGLMEVYRSGQVAIANAPGTGVADDKVIYTYVPKVIKYYLGEEPILPNVPTFVCWDEKDREHVLKNMGSLVIKPAAESGGYGMLIGPHSSGKERREFARRIRENPRNYIAQPTLSLSRVPVLTEKGIEGRHVDLRPFILCGEEIYVLPGGLTRVALRKGSLVVNSSQGGGYKDTWVLSGETGT